MTRHLRLSLSATLAFAALAFTALSARAHAQDGVPELVRYGDLLYVEAHQVPSDSADVCRVDVLVRVSYDFMVFIRTEKASRDSAFTAGLSISCDLFTEKNEGVASSHHRAAIAAPDFATTNTRDKFLLFKQSLYMKEGKYRLTVAVDDNNSTRSRSVMIPLHARALEGKRVVLASVIPLAGVPGDTAALPVILGYGRSVMFTEKALLAVAAGPTAPERWTFILKRQLLEGEELVVDTFRADPFKVLTNVTGGARDGEVRSFPLAARKAAGNLYLFRFPFDTLDVGRYRLSIVAIRKGDQDTLTVPLRVFWRDMPLSLQDVDFAISAMTHILTDDESDSLSSGSLGDRIQQFRTYWKRRDPSPATIRNEAMEEYFRRVDQAYYRFQTLEMPNGVMSDRGKVYVLFGAPDDIRRLMQPGEPTQEIWLYNTLKRTFRFSDRNRNGDFRLIQQEGRPRDQRG